MKNAERESILNKTELSVILFDIDHFKKVNDQYGHLVGDIVLREVAIIIEESIGEKGMVGRYGGEEFISILPDITLKESWKIFEKIRKKIEKGSFSAMKIKLTISAGLASTKNNKDANLVSIADENLYIAKGSGRNRGIK